MLRSGIGFLIGNSISGCSYSIYIFISDFLGMSRIRVMRTWLKISSECSPTRISADGFFVYWVQNKKRKFWETNKNIYS